MKKKKILFMVQVPPPVHGAALRNLSLYESRLLHDHFNIKLLPLSFADSILNIGKITGKKILKSFGYAAKLVTTIISFKPDTAYFTITPAGGAFYRDCLFVLLLKLARIRIIYHLRGIGIYKARKHNWLNRMLYDFAFKNAYVVCLSKRQLKDIEGLPYRQHFVVPNGIKQEVGGEIPETTSHEELRLLFLSNFIRSKGVFEFLEALHLMRKTGLSFDAELVGADYDVTGAEIQQYIDEHKLADCVKVNGASFGKEKFRQLLHCDVFVFPTYYPFELFPGVILEAMQCGKPVISTHHAVIEDIVEEGITGYLVPPMDSKQLADKIMFVAEHPEEAKAVGRKAREKYIREYTLQKFEQNMLNVFSAV